MSEEKKTGKRAKLAATEPVAPEEPEDGTHILCECGCRWEGPIGESELLDLHTKDGRWARVKVGHRPETRHA